MKRHLWRQTLVMNPLIYSVMHLFYFFIYHPHPHRLYGGALTSSPVVFASVTEADKRLCMTALLLCWQIICFVDGEAHWRAKAPTVAVSSPGTAGLGGGVRTLDHHDPSFSFSAALDGDLWKRDGKEVLLVSTKCEVWLSFSGLLLACN